VSRARTGVAALVLVTTMVACSGGRQLRPLRIAVTESSGDFTLSLEEPVRTVACVVRDFRRSADDPAAVRVIWSARCRADCLTSVRYGDRSLESTVPATRLTASGEGDCYECELTGDDGRGVTRFRVTPRGGFEPCRPRVGEL
jgi:hypothetical protein